jgi:hypothetical protein
MAPLTVLAKSRPVANPSAGRELSVKKCDPALARISLVMTRPKPVRRGKPRPAIALGLGRSGALAVAF